MRKSISDGFIPELDGLREAAACGLLVLVAACQSSNTARDDGGVPVDGALDAGLVAVDAASVDAPPDAPPPPPPPVLYPEDRIQSPITPDIAAKLKSHVGSNTNAQMFSKVGDSITVSPYFFNCFGGGGFSRVSLSAHSGWSTAEPLAGSPCPLDQELAAVHPRYAIVMLGTNDLRAGRTVDSFGSNLWTITDRILASGAIPILSTVPALYDTSGGNARVPLFNRVVRAIAQGRAVPLIDYHLAMDPLPNDGIGSDGIHPTVDPSGACILTPQGLGYGYNVRNLTALDALDRSRRTVAGESLDADAPRRQGHGTHTDPFVGSLPLVDLADTRHGELSFTTYTPCGLTASGHEVVYRVDLASSTALAAYVVDRDGVDVDVAILEGSQSAASCVASGDHGASATVGPGSAYIVVDSKTVANEGEFLLVVQQQ